MAETRYAPNEVVPVHLYLFFSNNSSSLCFSIRLLIFMKLDFKSFFASARGVSLYFSQIHLFNSGVVFQVYPLAGISGFSLFPKATLPANIPKPLSFFNTATPFLLNHPHLFSPNHTTLNAFTRTINLSFLC